MLLLTWALRTADLDAYEELVEELKEQLAYIDTRAITKAGAEGAEAAADWAEQTAKPIRSQMEQAQNALDRIKSAQSWRRGLEGGLERLLTLEVEWTPEGQKEVDAMNDEHHTNLAPGDDQWLDMLREDVAGVLYSPDTTHTFSRWASEWTRHMAHFLNVTVTLRESYVHGCGVREELEGLPEAWEEVPLADIPEVVVDFSPQAGIQKGSVSWAVVDLNH